jgi:hypothetical protein
MENNESGIKGSTDVLMVEKVATKSPVTPDLSAEIALTVERLKGERVKCRRIFGDNYRCNWLTVDEGAAQRGRSLALDSYRIRTSKFLRVKKVGEQLVIEDMTLQTAGSN